jgi:hypothetical protein
MEFFGQGPMDGLIVMKEIEQGKIGQPPGNDRIQVKFRRIRDSLW